MVKTERTSGMLFRMPATSSVVRMVSASVAPGGSSSEITVRAASSDGMKPVGSSDVLQIEPANSPMPTSSVR